jgi:hypothetical protein
MILSQIQRIQHRVAHPHPRQLLSELRGTPVLDVGSRQSLPSRIHPYLAVILQRK